MDIVRGIIGFVLVLFLILGISLFPTDPILGVTAILLTIIMMALVFEPASGKAMLKLLLPAIILLLILHAIFSSLGRVDPQQAVVIAMITFIIFMVASSLVGHVKSASVFAPMVVIPTLVALLIDPTGKLAMVLSTSLMVGFLAVVWYLMRKLGPPIDMRFVERFGKVVEVGDNLVRVKLGGELWWAIPGRWKFRPGDVVYAEDMRGLKLIISPVVTCPACGEMYPISAAPQYCRKCGHPLTEEVLKAIDKYRAEAESP